MADEQEQGFPNDEADPAAEFLKREQDELAGIDDEEFNQQDAQVEPELQTNGPIVNGEAEVEPSNEEDGGGVWDAISQADRQYQEPEKIKMWRQEQQERLEKKDAEEEKKKIEMKEAAKKELDQWYDKQSEQLKKTKVNNREAEAVFLRERDSESPGQDWEKIAKLCDFNPKTSKHTKDISRLRSIILQLKGQDMQAKA